MIIYSALFGKYDRPFPTLKYKNVSWILFTDTPEVEAPGWDVHEVPSQFGNPRLDAKYWKVHPPSGQTVWIDCSVQVLGEHTIDMFFRSLSAGDLAMWLHPSYKTLQEEAQACVRTGLDPNAFQQLSDYKEIVPFPENLPVWMGGIIARNSTCAVNRLNKTWWAHIQKYPERDQLSLPLALYLSGVTMTPLEGTVSHNMYVGIGDHRSW